MKSEIDVLLVEDDSVDVLGFRRVFGESSDPVNLHVVNQGMEALKFLESCQREDLPDLIILDLNMPVMGGLEFLGTIKSQSEHKRIPVVVMTTSREKEDIEKSYELGASGYMVKPLEHDQFAEKVNHLRNYWTACERFDFLDR